MSLQSVLFHGDPKLEAAATSDPAHIVPGAVGDHVAKIQRALIQLDSARIDPTELQTTKYGPSTATAVLAYKRKRNIINRSYQAQADNIVGKMTVAALDDELRRAAPAQGAVEFRVLSPVADRLDHRPHVVATPARGLMLNFSFAPAVYGAPSFSPGPVVSLNKGQTALVEVRNGAGGTIASGDPRIASVRDSSTRAALTHITSNPQTVEIVGNNRGGAVIVVNTASAPPLSLPQSMFVASLTVSVKESRRTVYTPTMTPHDHRPTGRWKELLAAIEQPTPTANGVVLAGLCGIRAEPMTFVNAAIAGLFRDKPVALKHLNWYLKDGRGQELNEDANIASWVRSDAGIRSRVTSFIVQNVTQGLHYSGFFAFNQSEFANDDYRFAFGTIDRLDVEVDWVAKTVKLWFMDSYEWHPVCSGFYTKFPDDAVRETNSLHAALVELKNQGGADYWMVGEATLPLTTFGFPP
jgi:peptidoglycan hydrolase-like protein with peptidoglycan-binding domain